MRTWKTCAHTFKWHVARRFPGQLKFYFSTIQDADTESWKLTKTLFPDCTAICDVVQEQPQLPEPAEPVRFEPHARSVPMQAVLRQLWQLERAWWFYSIQGDAAPDVIIRLRPDLFFHSFQFKYFPTKRQAQTPWWGRFGGINDRFAILDPLAAPDYFGTYSKLEKLTAAGCPIHPESLIKASLEDGKCEVYDKLGVEFSSLRNDGTSRPPEISAVDVANRSY